MGYQVTVQSILDEARSLADMENTEFVTDTELLQWINKGYQRMHNKLNNAYEMYRVTSQDITTVQDQKDYDLAADFLKLVKVMYVNDDEREYPIRRKDLNTSDWLTWRRGWPLLYSLLGQKIRFYPVPQSGHVMRLYYVPAVPELLITDTIDVEQYMDEYIAHYVAVKCKIKEETSAAELMVERDKLERECVETAAPRDFSDAAVIQDVEYNDGNDRYFRRFY